MSRLQDSLELYYWGNARLGSIKNIWEQTGVMFGFMRLCLGTLSCAIALICHVDLVVKTARKKAFTSYGSNVKVRELVRFAPDTQIVSNCLLAVKGTMHVVNVYCIYSTGPEVLNEESRILYVTANPFLVNEIFLNQILNKSFGTYTTTV